MPRMDLANVSLIHRGPKLHPREIAGDQKQARSAQTRNNRLAHVHTAIDNHAFDRRGNRAVFQVRLGGFQSGFCLLDGRLGGCEVRLGSLEIGK